MMRSPRFFAVACRRQNKEIVLQQESVESLFKKFQWLNKPFLRGTLAVIDALVLGMKSLTFSANVAMEDTQQPNPKKGKQSTAGTGSADPEAPQDPQGQPAKTKHQAVNDIAIGVTLFLGIALGLGVFVVGPRLLVGLMRKSVHHSVLLNLMTGGVKLILLVAYIAAISLMADIRRVFEYHGAEHKVINTFEAGMELTPENFSKHTAIHPRCGTSFIMVFVVASILVFCLLGWSSIWLRVVQELALLPVVAGVAYEAIRYAGRHKDSKALNVLLAPGLWLQRLTTREPTDDQVEVALCALRAVMEMERANSRQPVVGSAGCSA